MIAHARAMLSMPRRAPPGHLLRLHERLNRGVRRLLARRRGPLIEQAEVRVLFRLAFQIEEREPKANDAAVLRTGLEALRNLRRFRLLEYRGILRVHQRRRRACEIGSAAFGRDPSAP